MANYTTVQDDRSHLDREHDKRSLNYNAPLSQGKTYLQDRSKMCKGLAKNLKLIEGFQDQQGTNKNVVAGLTHATDKDNIKFRKPVLDENTKEFSELMAMQNSLNDVKTQFNSRVQDFIVQAKGQNAVHQACLKKCNDQTNMDSKSACQYGCNVGYFANQGPNVRRVGTTEGGALEPPAGAVLAEVFSGAAAGALIGLSGGAALAGALGGGAAVGGGIALEGFQGREGFTPGAPSTTGGGNPNVGNNNNDVMGSYGTTGYGKQLVAPDSNAQRAIGGTQINTLLGNVPVHDDGTAVPGQPGSGDRFGKVDGYKLFSGYDYHNMSPEQSLQQYPNSEAGLRARAINTATLKLSNQLESGPLVDRMAAANLSATNLGNYMTQLRSQWKAVFQKACAYGIGGVKGSNGAKFAGHTQHCKSWTNTAEGRSGYYSQTNPNNPSYSNPGPKGTPYTVNKEGQMQEFLGVQTNLANQPPLGCDTVIPGTRKNESTVGGAGFCECADGTYRYADTGHPSFTCNQACAPENSSITKNTPLYHNSNNWKPGLPYIGNQEGFQSRREGMTAGQSRSACKASAAAAGKKFVPCMSNESPCAGQGLANTYWKSGCFLSPDGAVYFNEDPTGGNHGTAFTSAPRAPNYLGKGYCSDGRDKIQNPGVTLESCEAYCSEDPTCTGYAFSTANNVKGANHNPACLRSSTGCKTRTVNQFDWKGYSMAAPKSAAAPAAAPTDGHCVECSPSAVKMNLGMQYSKPPLFKTICPSRKNQSQCHAAGGTWQTSSQVKPDAGCPPSMPYMREYGNSGQYYCYENPDGNKTGRGNVCSCKCTYLGPDGKGVCNQNQKPCPAHPIACPTPPVPPPVVHKTKLPGGAAALAAKGAPFLQCGTLSKESNGTYVQGKAAPPCPNGMISYPQQPGAQSMTQCGSKTWGSEKRHCDAFLGDWWCDLFNTWKGVNRSAGDIINQGRLCIYPEPKGYNKGEINVIGKLKKLPTAQQLVDTCSGGSSTDAPYVNMKLAQLEIKVLGLVLLKKAAILYEAVQQAYSGSNAAALKRSVEGRQLLKNLSKYKQAYKAVRIQKNQNLLLQGMLEDSSLKRGATNISYYLWFALAIAGAGLVVKKINN